jgi:uncharacterized membrane protein
LPLTPVALAHGEPGSNLRAHLLANVAYLAVLVPLLPAVGLVAAGIAYLVYYLVWSSTMLLYTREMSRRALA